MGRVLSLEIKTHIQTSFISFFVAVIREKAAEPQQAQGENGEEKTRGPRRRRRSGRQHERREHPVLEQERLSQDDLVPRVGRVQPRLELEELVDKRKVLARVRV